MRFFEKRVMIPAAAVGIAGLLCFSGLRGKKLELSRNRSDTDPPRHRIGRFDYGESGVQSEVTRQPELSSGKHPLTPLSSETLVNQQGRGEGEASDLWFNGFLLIQEAGKLEKQGELLTALNCLLDAKLAFNRVAGSYPEFHPEMVAFRRRNLDLEIEVIRTKLHTGTSSNGPSLKTGFPARFEMPPARKVEGNPLVITLPEYFKTAGEIPIEKYDPDGRPTGKPLPSGTPVEISHPSDPDRKLWFRVP